jgi:uncharacterized protein YbaR (Trm112 family)
MRLCRRVGWDSLAWSLRRLHCPVHKDALVLEVGSGGNPYYRANVLSDAYEVTRQRHWVGLVADRPTVIGFAENLPFRDKAFDFVIASHVLEHSPHPARFLGELERVAKAGYIEVPDALMERLNPYLDHRLEITMREGRLVIRKKEAWRQDPEVVELYDHRAGRFIAGETIPRHPFEFHVRYYWSGSIDYVVVNPNANAGWQPPAASTPAPRPTFRQILNAAVLSILRLCLSQSRRNRKLDLLDLLRCPACHGDSLETGSGQLICRGCGRRYPVRDGIPHLALEAA